MFYYHNSHQFYGLFYVCLFFFDFCLFLRLIFSLLFHTASIPECLSVSLLFFLSYFLSFTLLFLLISLSIFVFLSHILSFFLNFCLSFSLSPVSLYFPFILSHSAFLFPFAAFSRWYIYSMKMNIYLECIKVKRVSHKQACDIIVISSLSP